MQRITKSAARKAYNSGKEITLNPSKMRLNGVWSMAQTVSKQILDSPLSDAPEFDSLVNSFSYYNCTNETGNVVHFYIG